MANFQRNTWATFLFIALLSPFAIVLVLMLMAPSRQSATRPATEPAKPAQPLVGPRIVRPPSRSTNPLFAAGDQKTLWVAHPASLDVSGKKMPVFELLSRASNSNTWSLIRDARGNPYFQSYPRGLAAVSPPHLAKVRASPYVFLNHGTVKVFYANSSEIEENLPPDHTLLATAGSSTGLFAITAGAPIPSTTRPGDILDLTEQAATKPAATTTSQPASHPAASQPTTAAALPMINAYWFHDSHWHMLPILGAASESSHDAPSASATVALAVQGERIIAFWVEPSDPASLIARSLEYHDAKTWSPPVLSTLPEHVPQNARLLPVVLDQAVYLFWPVMPGASSTLELHGGHILTNIGDGRGDLTLPIKNFLPPLSLKGAGEGLNPATDVALGPAENSIAVIVNTRDNSLTSFLFNDRGQLLKGPVAVVPESPHREVEFAQNIAMLLLILMLTLSFWQWRQRPTVLKLPAGMQIARPGLRAAAFLIDFAIPYLIVCTIYGLWENGGYTALVSTAGRSVLNFDVLFHSPALLLWLGLYLLHVTLGELFFRRSIGKALVGIEVLMIDGKPPTVAAILVRNLIRLPELLLGILVIYFFFSPYRQRLGDLVGRTLVISHKPPGATNDSESPPSPGSSS